MHVGGITNRVTTARNHVSVSAILTGADIYNGTTDINPPSCIMPVSITTTGNFKVDPAYSFLGVRLIRATEIRLKDLKLCKSNVAQTKQRHKTDQKHQFLTHYIPPFAQDNNNRGSSTPILYKNQNNSHFQQASNTLNTCFPSEAFLKWSPGRTLCAPLASHYTSFPPISAQETVPTLPTTKSLPLASSYVQDNILLTRLLVLKKTQITRLQGSRCLLSLSAYIPDALPFCQEKNPPIIGLYGYSAIMTCKALRPAGI